MSQLSDRHIIQRARDGLITPWNPEQLQPASYDVRLFHIIRISHFRDTRVLDLGDTDTLVNRTDEYDLNEHRGYMLQPNRFILAGTAERVDIPTNMVGRIEGKSSLARLGLQIHCAGFLDPGFRGNVTMEIVNLFDLPIILRPGILIAQLSFDYLCERASAPYKGRYQDSQGVIGSRYHPEGKSWQ